MSCKKDDQLLKEAFELVFPDLLRFYFNSADNIFDMDRSFEFLNKEFIELFPEPSTRAGTRFVDMLVKVYLKNGREEWILVHLEIEAARGTSFSYRMFQYWYRIHDRYGVNIVAMAVFTSKNKHYRPRLFCHEFLGTKLSYEYNTYHILDHDEDALLAMNNPFALVVIAAQKALLAGKIPEEELGEKRLALAKAFIACGKYDKGKIARFFKFLKTFLYIEDQEINSNFNEQICLITKQEINMGLDEIIREFYTEKGIEKGMEKGIEKGKEIAKQTAHTQFVTYLLQHTNHTMNEIAALVGEPVAFVEQVKENLTKEVC